MRRLHNLPLEPAQSAVIAGLRYGGHQSAGYTRRRRGKNFQYFDTEGKTLRNKSELARIRSLVIPPAWTKVWICPDPAGHLQAVGYDARGRKQYRYHPAYRAVRNQTKYDRVPEIANAIALTRQHIRDDLALAGMPREKVLATVIRILDATAMRVGNEGSASENHTFGLTTLRNQHVEVTGATLRFHFTGKSGIRHELEITDRRVARVVRQCHDLPGQKLFEYVSESGELCGVSSGDVNEYLRAVSGHSLTAKDFRTWTGTVECAVALRDIGEFSSETEAKRNIVAAIKIAARRLGNRAATCRAYYVHPTVTEAYLAGNLIAAMKRSRAEAADDSLSADEKAVLDIVQHHHFDLEGVRQAVA